MPVRHYFSLIRSQPGILHAIFAMMAAVAVSNYLVQYQINDWLTWGAFPYPVCFLITELTNRNFGTQAAKTVVYFGFVLGVIVSSFLNIPKIALASGTAFLVAQLFDIAIFNRYKYAAWWLGPMAASSAASVIDTIVFTTIAFWGEGMLILTFAIGDFSIKMLIDVLMLVPFRLYTVRKVINSRI